MKSDCGAPAFENIDDLLAEKITRHSVHHSDTSSPAPSQAQERVRRTTASPSKSTPTAKAGGNNTLLILLLLLLIAAVLYNTISRPSSD